MKINPMIRLGQRFGHLMVIEWADPHIGTNGHRIAKWTVRCDCGQTKAVQQSNLNNGRTTSCGCLKTRHGKSKTKTYRVWTNMLTRCINQGSRHYQWYGARGIEVCKRWRDFANFLADMGEKPDGLSLDRINNDGNYELSNCRWATNSEQSATQRRPGPRGLGPSFPSRYFDALGTGGPLDRLVPSKDMFFQKRKVGRPRKTEHGHSR